MSSLRLPQTPQSTFFYYADLAREMAESGAAFTSVATEAKALLQRIISDGGPRDLYALTGLLAGFGQNDLDACDAVTQFIQQVTTFTPPGDSIGPGELAYDLVVAQAPLDAEPAESSGRKRVERDLSAWVTVFVSTVGYPTFERCMDCLRAQNCDFELKVIDNVAPMSAAFQQMLDQCETPFYVQVDEDMLLYPQAVRTLFETMRDLDDSAAMYVACLFDEHMDRAIYGLKIFRTEIVRRYPLRDVEGFEWEQQSRWRRDGYRDIREPVEQADRSAPRTLGLHGTHWTPLMIYIRYFVLEQTRRKGNETHQWVAEESSTLLRRFLEKRANIDLYALGGIVAGRLLPQLSTGRSKHFEQYQQTPGFEAFQRFVEAL